MNAERNDLHDLWSQNRGDEFLEALYYELCRLMTYVVRDQVIDLHGQEPSEYAIGCVSEFWIDKLGPSTDRKGKIIDSTPRIHGIMQRCETDCRLQAYLRTMMKKWMRTRLMKQHPEGSLSESIRSRLRNDNRFQLYGENRWGITFGISSPSQEPIGKLLNVARHCPLDVKKPKEDAKRAANIGESGELSDLLYSVLEAARGTMTLMALTDIVNDRCGFVSAVTTVSDQTWSMAMNDDGTHWTFLNRSSVNNND